MEDTLPYRRVAVLYECHHKLVSYTGGRHESESQWETVESVTGVMMRGVLSIRGRDCRDVTFSRHLSPQWAPSLHAASHASTSLITAYIPRFVSVLFVPVSDHE